jgi:hypothetical protein
VDGGIARDGIKGVEVDGFMVLPGHRRDVRWTGTTIRRARTPGKAAATNGRIRGMNGNRSR